MKLERLGNKNAVVITKANGTQVLVSYSTPVAAFVPGEGYFSTDEKLSRTTSKQITQWLRENNADGWSKLKPQAYFDQLV